MPKIKNHVRLSLDERNILLDLIRKGTATAKIIMHANVLLAADENAGDIKKSEIIRSLRVDAVLVELSPH